MPPNVADLVLLIGVLHRLLEAVPFAVRLIPKLAMLLRLLSIGLGAIMTAPLLVVSAAAAVAKYRRCRSSTR